MTGAVRLTLLAALGASACSPTPAAPTATPKTIEDGGVKITAPAILTPPGGRLSGAARQAPAIIVQNIRATFPGAPTTYDIEVRNPKGDLLVSVNVPAGAGSTTQYDIVERLESFVPLTARARARGGEMTGPWSEPRIFEIDALTQVEGIHFEMELWHGPQQLTATSRIGRSTVDCTDTALWTTQDPDNGLLTARGLFTPLRTGRNRLRGTCDGDFDQATTNVVHEIWTGPFVYTACTPLFGGGADCLSNRFGPVGRTVTAWFTIRDGGTARLELGGVEINAESGRSENGRPSIEGQTAFHPFEPCDLPGRLDTKVRADDGTVWMEVATVRQCLPGQPIVARTLVEGRLGPLARITFRPR